MDTVSFYDSHGNETGIKDPLNNLTTLTYTSTGQIEILTDANNHTTSYQYDSQDRVTTVINADVTTDEYVYNNQGNVTKLTDEHNNATTYSCSSFVATKVLGFPPRTLYADVVQSGEEPAAPVSSPEPPSSFPLLCSALFLARSPSVLGKRLDPKIACSAISQGISKHSPSQRQNAHVFLYANTGRFQDYRLESP